MCPILGKRNIKKGTIKNLELKIEGLTKKYGEKTALKDFSYTFSSGIYGILGANGAGKSTLMNLITDNVKRTEGKILWEGTDILELGKKFRSLVGYMPQQQGMYPEYSAVGFLRYIASVKEIPRKAANEQIGQLLEVVNLKDAAHKKLGGFSGGMKQRVLLAQALLGSPMVLILDEPTAGLDPKERLRLRNYINDLSENRIVFLTTHIVSDIESIAEDVLLMKDGQLVTHGAPADLIASVSGNNLEDVYMAYLGSE